MSKYRRHNAGPQTTRPLSPDQRQRRKEKLAPHSADCECPSCVKKRAEIDRQANDVRTLRALAVLNGNESLLNSDRWDITGQRLAAFYSTHSMLRHRGKSSTPLMRPAWLMYLDAFTLRRALGTMLRHYPVHGRLLIGHFFEDKTMDELGQVEFMSRWTVSRYLNDCVEHLHDVIDGIVRDPILVRST